MTTTHTNLRDLLTRAAAGHLQPFGTFIPLDTAARLYAAAARDLDEGNCGSADEAGKLPVDLETSDGDTATLSINGLRYVVDLEIGGGVDTVTSLCIVPDCPNPALGRTRLARVCDDHLGHVDELAKFLLNIPRAGDDRPVGWEEQAVRDIRAKRLDAWEQEITETVDKLNGRDLFRLKRMRDR